MDGGVEELSSTQVELLLVVLPDPFREIGAWRNSAPPGRVGTGSATRPLTMDGGVEEHSSTQVDGGVEELSSPR